MGQVWAAEKPRESKNIGGAYEAALRLPAAGSMSVLRVFLFFFILGSLLGCAEALDPVPPITSALDAGMERARRDSVLALLTGADRGALDAAFGKLSGFEYERRAVVRQLDETGELMAERVWSDRFEGTGASRRRLVVSADSMGRFADGFFGRFSDRAVPEESDSELAPFILPTDAPYLTGRGREAYRFRFLADSVAHDLRFRRVLIEVDPNEPGRHQLRRIQITLDPTAEYIVGASVLFDHHSLLYRERSRFDFRLQPADTVWLPDRLDMESRIGSGAFDERHFRVHLVWSNLRPAS